MRATLSLRTGHRIILEATRDDPRSRYHIPALVLAAWEEHPALIGQEGGAPIGMHWPLDEDLLDGATFRALRDACGCRLETDDPDAVCRALGVPAGEPGVVEG